MEPVFVETWLLGPLLMLVVAWGCGLLVRRLAAGALPAVMVLPVGYALTVAVTAFLTGFSGSIATLSAPAICVLAGLGLLLERGTIVGAWRARRWRASAALWPAAVAFAAFAVVAAPVVLSGHVTYTGYARIVDIAHQFDFTRWLVEHGRLRPPTRDFSYVEVVTKTLDIGYPAGGQSALGSFARLLAVDIPWVWQVFMAFNGAMLGLALYGLLGRAIDNRPLRALAAGVAAQPNILYGYALVGGIKEFTSAASLVAVAALLPPLLAERPVSVRALIPLGVAVAAALAAFSLTIVPWLGVIAAGVVLLLLTRRGRVASLGRVAFVSVVGLALAAPTAYLGITKLLPVAGEAEGSGATVLTDLGNLGGAMPVRAVSGVWISGDYRFPSGGDTPLTNTLIVVAFVLVALGAFRVLRRRDWPVLLIGAAVALALLYYVERTGPWIQFKAFTTSAPVVLAFAFIGAAELGSLARRLLRGRRLALGVGWLAAVVIAGGVLLGNAEAYHDVTLAPHERIRDLQALGGELRGAPALLPYWEEVGEYELRRQHVSARPNGFLQIRPGVPLDQQFAYDPDDFVFPYLESQQLLVLRRGPTTSRPPANYRLERRTASYDVWRRVAPPSSVLEHVPSPDFTRRDRTGQCQALMRAAARGGPGVRLAYAERPPVTTTLLDGAGTVLTGLWQRAGHGALFMYGPGDARRGVSLPRGTFDVWIAGAIARPLHVVLDGHQIGTVSDAWTYPGGWTHVGVTTSGGGLHKLDLQRGGGSLAPGNGADDQPIGPLAFVRRGSSAGVVRYAPVSRAPALCRRVGHLDWLELVRGLGPGAQTATAR